MEDQPQKVMLALILASELLDAAVVFLPAADEKDVEPATLSILPLPSSVM